MSLRYYIFKKTLRRSKETNSASLFLSFTSHSFNPPEPICCGKEAGIGMKWNHLVSSIAYLAHSTVHLSLFIPSSIFLSPAVPHNKGLEVKQDSLGLLFILHPVFPLPISNSWTFSVKWKRLCTLNECCFAVFNMHCWIYFNVLF